MSLLPNGFLNGEQMDTRNPVVDVQDLGLNRGYAVFDYLRSNGEQPLFLQQHLQRLSQSATGLGLPMHHSHLSITKMVSAIVQQNPGQPLGIKILLSASGNVDGNEALGANLLITAETLPLTHSALYEQGIHLMTYEYQRPLPAIKSTHYLMGIWLKPKIKACGAQDVLYYSQHGVLETPRSNFFLVDAQGVLRTASAQVLQGITRSRVLTLCNKYAIPLVEENFEPGLLHQAREAFITSTTKGILPVTSIDGKAVGNGKPGPVAKLLSNYLQISEAKHVQELLHAAGFH